MMNDVVSSSVLNSMNELLPLSVKLVVTRQPGQPLCTLEERVPPKRSMVCVAVETWPTQTSNTYLNRESWKVKCLQSQNYPMQNLYMCHWQALSYCTRYVISSKTSFIVLALFCGGTVKLIMVTRTCQHFYGISLYSNQASPGHSWRCGLCLVAK